MCLGGPILAYLASAAKSNVIIIALTGILTVAIFIYLLLVHDIDITILKGIMFFLGILCCYQVLIFAFVSDIVDRSCAGIAIAIINCLNMSFGHFFHHFISQNIQNNWDGTHTELGIPVYNFDSYLYGISIIPIGSLIGTLVFVYMAFIKIPKKV
jgi:hypothetical protein